MKFGEPARILVLEYKLLEHLFGEDWKEEDQQNSSNVGLMTSQARWGKKTLQEKKIQTKNLIVQREEEGLSIHLSVFLSRKFAHYSRERVGKTDDTGNLLCTLSTFHIELHSNVYSNLKTL